MTRRSDGEETVVDDNLATYADLVRAADGSYSPREVVDESDADDTEERGEGDLPEGEPAAEEQDDGADGDSADDSEDSPEDGADPGPDSDEAAEEDDEPAAASNEDADGEGDEVDPVLALRLERLEASAEHWRTAHDELTGKHGKRVKELLDEIEGLKGRQSRTPDGYQDADYNPAAEEIRQLREEIRSLKAPQQDTRGQGDAEAAVFQELMAFRGGTRFKDYTQYEEKIAETVKKVWGDITESVNQGDGDRARLLMRGALQEGYYDAKEEQLAARRKEALERKEGQRKNLRRKKKLATPSGAGSRKSSQEAAPVDPETLDPHTRWWSDPKVVERIERSQRKAGRQGF